ncbi:transposase [Brucella sp. 22210]|uniref:transposase n=1 Tax=Brucella sp. 22210 TaxID=3453892 RepID=UPI003F87A43E
MTDEKIADTNQAVRKTARSVDITKKTRAPRKKAEPKPAKNKTAKIAAKTAPVIAEKAARKSKHYTPAQRASLLADIENATRNGKSTLKAVLQQTKVSEQTYYNWKNAAKKIAADSPGDDLSALITLEAENVKLRKELAIKLRTENAELRKRLGKD